VEKEEEINKEFCYDVMAGLLEEDVYKLRKHRFVDKVEEERRLKKLKEEFATYDWTQYVDMQS
jgi:hypothetical protein